MKILKKISVPLISAFLTVLVVGAYFTHAGLTITETADELEEQEQQQEETVEEQVEGDSDTVTINGEEIEKDENGCAESGGLSICSNADNDSSDRTNTPTPIPDNSQTTSNDTSQCREVCVSYETVCE